MTQQRVAIVRTGVANVASIRAAFARHEIQTALIDTASEVERAPLVVLPGVGSFGAGMDALARADLVGVLRDRISQDRPTLAICLGLQLLCASSEESPGVQGLGVIDAEVRSLNAPDLRVPQFGWNSVCAPDDLRYLQSGYAYYANSYALLGEVPGWKAALSTYGVPFVAALERGRCLACQFHPELSGEYGSQLLRRWLSISKEALPC